MNVKDGFNVNPTSNPHFTPSSVNMEYMFIPYVSENDGTSLKIN